jgi:hypothetical protein
MKPHTTLIVFIVVLVLFNLTIVYANETKQKTFKCSIIKIHPSKKPGCCYGKKFIKALKKSSVALRTARKSLNKATKLGTTVAHDTAKKNISIATAAVKELMYEHSKLKNNRLKRKIIRTVHRIKKAVKKLRKKARKALPKVKKVVHKVVKIPKTVVHKAIKKATTNVNTPQQPVVNDILNKASKAIEASKNARTSGQHAVIAQTTAELRQVAKQYRSFVVTVSQKAQADMEKAIRKLTHRPNNSLPLSVRLRQMRARRNLQKKVSFLRKIAKKGGPKGKRAKKMIKKIFKLKKVAKLGRVFKRKTNNKVQKAVRKAKSAIKKARKASNKVRRLARRLRKTRGRKARRFVRKALKRAKKALRKIRRAARKARKLAKRAKRSAQRQIRKV